MRGTFGLERCCCDCVPCPNCQTGLAAKRIWVHLFQGDPDFDGPLDLVQTSECRWESTDESLPRSAVMVISLDSVQLVVANSGRTEVAIWDYTAELGDDVNCGYFPETFWECREDTGTIACPAEAELIVQPYELTNLEAWETEYVEITDQDGNTIEGAAAARCEAGVECGWCNTEVSPERVWLVVGGYVDDVDGTWSVLNGTWQLDFFNDPWGPSTTPISLRPACAYFSQRIDTGYQVPSTLSAYISMNPGFATHIVEAKATRLVGGAGEFFTRTDPETDPAWPSDCFGFDNFSIPLSSNNNQPNATVSLYTYPP